MADELTASSEPTEQMKKGPGLLSRVVRGGLVLLLLSLVGVVAGGGALVYPYLRDDYALDLIVPAVALDWRDFGREKAEERLRFELAQAAVGPAVGPGACALSLDDAERVVRCDWAVRVALPGGRSWPLAFVSEARIDAEGDLR